MTRTPKPGNRLLPKTPHGKIHAVTESGLVYACAPEVRITTSITDPDGTIAVAMWEGAGRNVCYIPISDLDPSTYVFSGGINETIESHVNANDLDPSTYVFSDEINDSRTVIDSITPNDLGKLVRVSGKEKSITGYLVDIHASMNPLHVGASYPVSPYSATEICLRSVSHYMDTTTVRIYPDDQIEFLDEE